MQRYFTDRDTDGKFSIAGDDFHHITRVMRMKEGDSIICAVRGGRSAVCRIAEITDEQVIAEVVQWKEASSELPIKAAIASGLPKGDKLELIIQKGTELGASVFIPFTAARSIVKWDEKKAGKKTERWQKIAKEAAEQSHRDMQPDVLQPVSMKELIELGEVYDHKVIAYEEDAKDGESSAFASILAGMEEGQSLLMVFGPEGGFSEKEAALLKDNGFVSCGLGPRILRTETAPLYALAAVSYHFELMR
ncbi:16S rRNA (uracil(1498)-N(3))-methyltransferase [Bacillus infantis]|uniref:16S rRNA (uracil(1498)-N(3))-methyltransferase n=1 Tax=Bacillus infantis TaxID=324767 RepID=UPI002155140E|nr:16S rRNA (uracil(1498)-N(3))-methyltransferase [Bacillus infantis]MCR6612042.1 16S rRNA (uracil(1498)-N(3))-methyltransferase [Bacillus infantis]